MKKVGAVALIAVLAISSLLAANMTREEKMAMDVNIPGTPEYALGVKYVDPKVETWTDLLTEDFESGTMPVGWTVIDYNSDGYMWEVGYDGFYAPPDCGSYFAFYDDDAAGVTPITIEQMILPAVAIPSGALNLRMTYTYCFEEYGGAPFECGYVHAKFFVGGSWNPWSNLVTYSSDLYDYDTLDMTLYLPADSVRIKFSYWDNNQWAWGFGVDNIVLSYYSDVPGPRLSEGFESINVPPNWTVLDEDADGYGWQAYYSSLYAHSGDYSFACRFNSWGNDDWLITPLLHVGPAPDSFCFWACSHSSTYLETFEVWLSTTGNSVGDFTNLLGTEVDIPEDYILYSYNLDAYSGQDIYIAIRCISDDMLYLHVDDVDGPEIHITHPTTGIVINEIMQNPNQVWDSKGEWFELYNETAVDVDMNGWVILDRDFDYHLINNGAPLILPAYGFLVLGRNANPAENGGYTCDYEYSDFYLGNSGDEVVLVNPDGVVVDSVYYDGGPEFPDPTGASMELNDPTLDNMVGANWHTAYFPYGDGDYGTPGERNCPPDPYEPNNNLGEAFPIDSGDVFTDCWIYPPKPYKETGDLDYFTFDGNYGDSVHIYAIPLNEDTLDHAVALMDGGGNVIARVDAGWSGDPEILHAQLPGGGTFYILVAYWQDVPYSKKDVKTVYREGPYSIEFIKTPPHYADYDASVGGAPNEGDPNIVNDTLVAPCILDAFIDVYNNGTPGGPAISFAVYYKLFDGNGDMVASKCEHVWDIEAQEHRMIYFQAGIPIIHAGTYTAAVTIQTAFTDPNPGNNVANRTFTVVGGVKMGAEEIPKVFALRGCEPNPIKGDAIISYQIPRDVDVTLKVYDSSGRLISALVDGSQSAGYYNVEWKPPHAGIYFYKLSAGDFKATKKLIVVE